MAASFPSAKKTFSAVVNGVTKLVAALFNSPYDEIEAIETFIGATGGGAQSYSESVTNMLYNYRRGCAVEYKTAADIYVRSGEIMTTDASGNRRLRRNTSDTTVNWTNIDTGSEAASTVYYVYAVADASATTFTVMISASATTPTGATFYKLLGNFYNDGSSNIDATRIVDLLDFTSYTASMGDYANNTVYQNTSARKLLVVASSLSGANGDIYALTDSANPPTTRVAYSHNQYDDNEKSVTFVVLPSHYFKVYSANGIEKCQGFEI